MMFGHVYECKEALDERVMKKIVDDLSRLGYKEVLPNGDSESSLEQVLDAFKRTQESPTMLQNHQVYDSQANGAGERAV